LHRVAMRIRAENRVNEGSCGKTTERIRRQTGEVQGETIPEVKRCTLEERGCVQTLMRFLEPKWAGFRFSGEGGKLDFI